MRFELLNKSSRINPCPIFVIGNQKTGTTAIAVLLAECADLTITTDILNVKEPVDTFIKLREGTMPFNEFVLRNKRLFSRSLVKDPNFIFLFESLFKCFPRSKFVFVIRDARDNIRSILNRLSVPGNLARLDPSIIENVNDRWKFALTGTLLRLRGDHYIEILFRRRNLAADVYLENRDRMTLIRYEDFSKDKIGEITRLAGQVGLKPKNDISKKVDIQYQPPGNHTLSWQDFFGRDNLRMVEDICEHKMKNFGYHRILLN